MSRLSVAIWAADASVSLLWYPQSHFPGFVAVGCLLAVAALALMGGILTPAFALITAVWAIAAMALALASGELPPIPVILSHAPIVLTAFATAMLGAGAYSTDALLFGRREIAIPDPSDRPSK